MAYEIRTYGDPVLKSAALEIQKIDDKLVRLTDEMFDIMYDAPVSAWRLLRSVFRRSCSFTTSAMGPTF